ncbi:homocysteine S-methyltransferase [Rhizobium sp. NFR07]|uniref:homocysteine S-methyltransferase family protein n=1 Tax=Rhizobium sp. NFR07 TaxID=1566262 RepID=UPI0008E2DBCB|nr:homocysteine S-methyltransferase family protein [Rhizobium sp. NFR07]SFB34537.1 homocysteine S-methyltransferase [Rhizobium sp. NFR07]
MNFVECLESAPVVLTEGAIVTRLVHEFGLPTPDSAAFAHLFSQRGREALAEIYRSYMAISGDFGLPMQVSTPTWRSHPDALRRLGFSDPDDLRRVSSEAVSFVQRVRQEMGLESQIYVAGVVGPRIDGYDAANAPDAFESESYHRTQTRELAAAGADLLYAPTFPASAELLGIARAFASTDLPYVLAPIVDAGGRLPDGTSMAEAVDLIDANVSRSPVHFIGGCVHPRHFQAGVAMTTWPKSARVQGLQGNASDLPPGVLDGLDRVEGNNPEVFADLMAHLHAGGMKVLGGCCGTNEQHIRAIARRFIAEKV